MADDNQTCDLLLNASEAGLDQLEPLGLEGEEALSRPFRLVVEARTADPADPTTLDPGTWLRRKVGVGLSWGGEPTWLHGVVIAVEHIGADPKQHQIYRLELAPSLALLAHTRRTRVFVDQKPLDVVRTVLSQGGVTAEIKASGAASQALRHITQYEESDLAFVSRLLEQEGACYWFTFTKSGHTLVIGDATAHHPGAGAAIKADYVGAAAGGGSGVGVITELSRRYEIVAKEATVRDYSESHPKTAAEGKKTVVTSNAPGAGGVHSEADYHVTQSDADATAYASRLADALVNRSCRVVGAGGVLAFRAGARIAVHGKEGYDEQILLTEVSHSFSGGDYRNRFSALPVGRLPWRPPRLTPIPRIDGMVPGIITATAGAQGEAVEGSYRVKLLNAEGEAARIVRMAQPYAGPAQGFHFPLPVNTEVLLTHTHGHPDRPVIAGAMHNAEDPSPVLDANKTQCVVRSAAGAELVFEDKDGEEKVTLASKTAHKLEFDDKEEKATLTSKGAQKLELDDKNKVTHLSVQDEKVTVEGKSETAVKGKQTIDCQDEIAITAQKKLTLTVGQSSITLEPSGKITIAGMEITISGKTKVAADAAEITLAAKAKLAASGAAVAIEAQGQLEAKANGMLTVQSSGITTVKGSMVMIN